MTRHAHYFMPRKPRTLAFENWVGKDGHHYCHLRSGREILMPAEGYPDIRRVKRLYEIITTRTPENTRYVTLSAPYQPKKKKRPSARP